MSVAVTDLLYAPVAALVPAVNRGMTPGEWREYLKARDRLDFFYLSNQVKRGHKKGAPSGASLTAS